MKLLWLDLNSSYAHSSLALPALHAQIADDTTIEWCIVSATINENTGMVVSRIHKHRPDIIAATNWLFNHEQLLHIISRAKALIRIAASYSAVRSFWEIMKPFYIRTNLSAECSVERVKKYSPNG